MMFANNIENTLNVYIVNDPAGNCGYNLLYGGIALKISCSGAGSYALAHEIGHALSLPHPFLGWEGGVSYDDSIEHDYLTPAPERVTYDYTYFKDTLILDTLIIDTAWVEKLDQSNCTFAADGFCDTPPDYLHARWNCNGQSLSNQLQTDPNGQVFYSDGTLIMGYANDNCQSRFTTEQVAAMRANLLDEKTNWLDNADLTLQPVGDVPAVLLSPLDGEVPTPAAITFSWEAVPNATYYLLEVSPFSSFTLGSTIVVETTAITQELYDFEEDKRYYWRVRAYNDGYFCAPISEDERFKTGLSSGLAPIAALDDLTILPNPVAAHSPFTIVLRLSQPTSLTFGLHNALGQMIDSRAADFAAGAHQFVWPSQLPVGLYWLSLDSADGHHTYRLVVQ